AGEHQIENAVTALTAIEILRKNSIIDVTKDKLYEGMKTAKQKARFEPVGDGFILDGAHNRDGMEALVQTMDDQFYGKKVLVLMGILADKAVDDVLDLIRYTADDFIVTEPPNTRKLSADKLAEKLEARGKRCFVEPVPKDALERAKEMKGGYDIVLCCGSLYLMGELRRLLCED
ncbi:MAG: bifunctional folylpolyglutamate synthase/dihydrofolate synthase, partial [Firmicutes bacterium]|nr:bifunctional folylpolyglutamate synthase/dihydrofolate synthase [Bacillota bacterium]